MTNVVSLSVGLWLLVIVNLRWPPSYEVSGNETMEEAKHDQCDDAYYLNHYLHIVVLSLSIMK